MLRKVLSILVLSLFVLSTTGFSISKHYCGDKLVSVKINAEPKPCCDMNGGGCCKNITEIYQLDEDFTFVQTSQIQNLLAFDITYFLQNDFELKPRLIPKSYYLDKGFIPPPDLSAILADIQAFRL